MTDPTEMPPYVAPLWNNINLEFMIKFCVMYFFVVWVALIIWVTKDIAYRSNSRTLQVFCVLIMILFTPLWVLLYILIRPRKSVYDKYNDEIEWNLWILSEIVQDHIETTTADYICPECWDDIIREWWSVCPYCETKQKKKKHKKNKDKKEKNKKSEKKKDKKTSEK
jgi:uncharacterized membrane protein (DUF485 family)